LGLPAPSRGLNGQDREPRVFSGSGQNAAIQHRTNAACWRQQLWRMFISNDGIGETSAPKDFGILRRGFFGIANC
jgi:hypothetical protein